MSDQTAPTRDAQTILEAVAAFSSLLSAYIVNTDPGTVRPALVRTAGAALHDLSGLLPVEVAADRPAAPGPLPAPVLSRHTPHRVTFPLSAAEFACLSALAERWGTSPDMAACAALCLDLDGRHRRESGRDANAAEV